MKKNTSIKAIEIVEDFLQKKYPMAKIKRVDSGKKSQDNKGFDILVRENGKKIKIEVKGTNEKKDGRKRIGIPDAFETQFEIRANSMKFVADFLYLVNFLKRKKGYRVYELPKTTIDKYSSQHKVVKHIKFASALKTELTNNAKEYLVADRS